MKISIIILKFLFIGALFIVSNENLYLSNPTDLAQFNQHFSTWLSNIFTQFWRITGYVFKSEWLPGNTGIKLPMG